MDKLTHPITVKFTPEGAAEAKALGEAQGFELSEYIRHLVRLDRDRMQRQFAVLATVFSRDSEQSTDTAGDTV